MMQKAHCTDWYITMEPTLVGHLFHGERALFFTSSGRAGTVLFTFRRRIGGESHGKP